MRPTIRPDPKMPVTSYKTYAISSPVDTHMRDATCREVNCQAMANGWIKYCDVSTVLGAQQANYIRLHSGRSYSVVENGVIVTFTFPAGQRCFAHHRVPVGRPELFVVRDGDHRGNPTGRRVERVAADWVEDFAEHQDKIAQRVQRG